MQHARPVQFPVGRSRRLERFTTVLWSCGAVAVGTWVAAATPTLTFTLLSVLLVALVGLLSRSACRSLVHGNLCWDGHSWRLDDQPGALDVIADGQGWILFRWRTSAVLQWGVAEGLNAPDRWNCMRRAVYSRADSDLRGEGSAKQPFR